VTLADCHTLSRTVLTCLIDESHSRSGWYAGN
jgi:hypothetical protein